MHKNKVASRTLYQQLQVTKTKIQVGKYIVCKDIVFGEGQFGKVVLAYEKSSPKKFIACKIIQMERIRRKDYFESEVRILKEVKNKNVIGLKEIINVPGRSQVCYQFFSLCNGGDLYHFVQTRKNIPENSGYRILQQIVNGLKALYQYKIIHRDLKLDNILIHFENVDMWGKDLMERRDFLKTVDLEREEFTIYIADLGFAKQVEQDHPLKHSYLGSPLYMSPEIMNGQRYMSKTDVWSLGATYFELLTGFPPFMANNQKDLAENMKRGTYVIPKHLELSLGCLQFLHECLQYDAEKRLSYEEMFNHKYLTKWKECNQKALHDHSIQHKIRLHLKQQDPRLETQMEQNPNQQLMIEDDFGMMTSANVLYLNAKENSPFDQIYEHTMQIYNQLITEENMSQERKSETMVSFQHDEMVVRDPFFPSLHEIKEDWENEVTLMPEHVSVNGHIHSYPIQHNDKTTLLLHGELKVCKTNYLIQQDEVKMILCPTQPCPFKLEDDIEKLVQAGKKGGIRNSRIGSAMKRSSLMDSGFGTPVKNYQ